MTGDGAMLTALYCKCREREMLCTESAVSPDTTCTLFRGLMQKMPVAKQILVFETV
jgi:hypothetical protein